MSREKEFRVYIKPLKRYATGYETILYHHQCNARHTWTVNISPEEYYGDEDLIVEQYTGDKDQYNTPICEGDIVRICETDIGEVLQDYDGRWIILGIPKEKLRDGDSVLLGNLEKLQKWCLADILSKEYCSVIGNIHENPELLEGKADGNN